MDRRRWHEFYDEGVPVALDYAPLTLPQILRRAAARYGDRPAVTFMNAHLNYRELEGQVERFAAALSRLGVVKGDRVALHMPNLPQLVVAFFATVRLGGVAVMTNPLYTPREIEHQWNDAGASVAVLMDILYESLVKKIREKLDVRHYVVSSIPDYLRFPLSLLAPLKLRRHDPPMMARVELGPNVHDFRALMRETSETAPTVELDWEELAMLQYTGGTTGRSKGAMLTHRNISSNVQQIAAWNQAMEFGRETCLACLPFFHIYGLTVAMALSVYGAGHMILMPDPRDIDAMFRNIVKHRVTLFPGVPVMYGGINHHPKSEKADLSSIKVCNSGAAPLPVDVLERFEELTGGRITEGYGLTEASPVTHSNPIFGRRKAGSIGIPAPDTDCRLVSLDDGTTEVPVGEEGEVLVKGPQVMAGYWDRPDETAAALRDGWLHTGDIARMDEDGFFYIVGRVKDMILCSGYNVYPDEIDRVLAGHPAILETATIGVPHEKRGETVKSFVVRKPGAQLTAEELTAYCRENLAAYKIPRIIEFRESLPKNPIKGILRRELRAQELAAQTRG